MEEEKGWNLVCLPKDMKNYFYISENMGNLSLTANLQML